MHLPRLKTLFLVLILSVVLTACGGGRDGTPAWPGDPNLKGGNGPVSGLSGKIVFADTDIGLRTWLIMRDGSAFTENGNFGIDVAQGISEYIIRNLIGEIRGELNHDGKTHHILRYPAFEGWSRDYFDEIMSFGDNTYTIRWPNGKEIEFWIDRDNPLMKQGTVDIILRAINRWQEVLRNEITFREIKNSNITDERGISIRLVTQDHFKQIGYDSHVIGYCQVTHGIENKQIKRGQIYIDHEYQDWYGVFLHELGHCIGLSHSPDWNDLMYFAIADKNKELSEKEINMARLLYSIPMGTPMFNQRMAVRVHHNHDVIYNPDGTVDIRMPLVLARD